jgi:hypothetical protein
MENMMPAKQIPTAASSRISAAAASLLLVFAATLTAPTEVRALVSNGLTYTVSGGNATVTGCEWVLVPVTLQLECYENPFIIPNSLDGHPVTAIGESAFANYGFTAVTLPPTLIEIGNMAFSENYLTAIEIPASVTTIGERAFQINRIKSLIIPDTVTTLGAAAFSDNKLTSLQISNSITEIGDATFAGGRLKSLTIPGSVTSIGYLAFAYHLLTTITIPSSVRSIGKEAFIGNKLKSVTFSEGLLTIGESVFESGVPNATAPNANVISAPLIIPSSVTAIGQRAFYFNKLSSVTFLGNAPTGGKDVFWHNLDLNKVMRPHGASGWGSTWSGISVGISDIQASATVKPSVTGSTAVNETLTAAKGTWAGYPSPAFTYQWYACTDAVVTAQSTVPVSCAKISGATKSTVKLKSAQQGKYIAVQVTGKSSRTAAVAWLSPTTVVVP